MVFTLGQDFSLIKPLIIRLVCRIEQSYALRHWRELETCQRSGLKVISCFFKKTLCCRQHCPHLTISNILFFKIVFKRSPFFPLKTKNYWSFIFLPGYYYFSWWDNSGGDVKLLSYNDGPDSRDILSIMYNLVVDHIVFWIILSSKYVSFALTVWWIASWEWAHSFIYSVPSISKHWCRHWSNNGEWCRKSSRFCGASILVKRERKWQVTNESNNSR